MSIGERNGNVQDSRVRATKVRLCLVHGALGVGTTRGFAGCQTVGRWHQLDARREDISVNFQRTSVLPTHLAAPALEGLSPSQSNDPDETLKFLDYITNKKVTSIGHNAQNP